MMTVVRISNFRDLDQREWDDLLVCSKNESIFMTWTWLSTWWEIYGADHELWWLNVRDENGQLVASAPLYVRKHANGLILPHRELRFIGTGMPVSPEHLDLLADPARATEALEALAQYLIAHAKDWDVLFLSDLTHKGNREPLAALKLADILGIQNIPVQVEEQLPLAPYIALPDAWEFYFKSLGKWLRRTITRQRNKQTRELDMSFYVWSKQDGDFDAVFNKFEQLYALRKKSMNIENKFEESLGYRKFHRLLASRFAEEGRLNLAFLKIGNQEVACEYTFKHLDTLYSYQCGFDPEFGKHNVFKVLRSYVIENAIGRGIKEFDLLRGEEDYKYDWKAVPRTKQAVRCFSPTFYGSTLKNMLGLRRGGKQILNQMFRRPAQPTQEKIQIGEDRED